MRILFNTTVYNTDNRTNSKYSTNFKSFNVQTIPRDVLEKLIEQGLSAPKIAKTLNVDVSHVVLNLKKYGLETKPRQAYYKLVDNIDELLKKGLSTTEIGKLYGMNRRDVYEVAVKVLGKEGFKKVRSLFIVRGADKRRPSEVAKRRASKMVQSVPKATSRSELIIRLRAYLAKLCNTTDDIKADVPEQNELKKMSKRQQAKRTSMEMRQMRELLRSCVLESLAHKKPVINISKECGIALPTLRTYIYTHISPSEKNEAKQLFYKRQKEHWMQEISQEEKLVKQEQAKVLLKLKSLVTKGYSDKKIEAEIGYSIEKIASVIGQEAYEKLKQERKQIQLKLIFTRMASGVPNKLIAKAFGISEQELDSIVKENKSNIDAFLD